MIELSRYGFETLREDEGLTFCRGRLNDGELPTILSLTPVSEHPDPEILEVGLSTNTRFGMSLIQTGRLDLSRLFAGRVAQCLYSRTLAANHSIGSWDNRWN